VGGQAGGWPGQGSGYRASPSAAGGWSGQGLLGPAPQQAYTAFAPSQFSQGLAPSWDQAGLIAALQQMSVQGSSPWVLDTSATTHMHSSEGILLSRTPLLHSSIVVGNGTHIPVTSRGQSFLPTTASNFVLNNVLVVPSIVCNLLSVRQFTRDNNCSIEFDAFGFSVKDLKTRHVILRCNSVGDLYTITAAAPTTAHALLAASTSLWHQRLGHPTPAIVASLRQNKHITCTKADHSLCHACQLGKHTHLPFSTSTSRTSSPFELVHCDVWTSPIPSVSGYSYYLVILDDFTHYCWTFPLHHKSDVHEQIVQFISYAQTQFNLPVKCFQTDNGREFINNATTSLLASRGIIFRHSCPCTSQNGKAERVLRTLNNSVRTMLMHASMPPCYWAEALSIATYLLNRRPSTSISGEIPYVRLHGCHPTYDHLWVFGCLCYPNLQATSPHKPSPRSAACVFLGYPSAHKGYRCLDLSTHRVIISRHVVFDELLFPSPATIPSPLPPLTFYRTMIRIYLCLALLTMLQLGRRSLHLRMLSSSLLPRHLALLVLVGMVLCPHQLLLQVPLVLVGAVLYPTRLFDVF